MENQEIIQAMSDQLADIQDRLDRYYDAFTKLVDTQIKFNEILLEISNSLKHEI